MSASEPDDPGDPAEERRRIAHEMRNSIGAIRTAAELLERRYRPEGRERRLFQVLLGEVDRLLATVDRTFGRPTRE